MSFGSFVCQNDIKLQQKQPLVVLYQQMCQKKKSTKSRWLLQRTTTFKIFSSKINLCKREKKKKKYLLSFVLVFALKYML